MTTKEDLRQQLYQRGYVAGDYVSEEGLINDLEHVEKWLTPSKEVELKEKNFKENAKAFSWHRGHYLSLDEPGVVQHFTGVNFHGMYLPFLGGAFRKKLNPQRPQRVLTGEEYKRLAPILRSLPSARELTEFCLSFRDELVPFFDDAKNFRTKLREQIKLMPLARIHMATPMWIRRSVASPTQELLKKFPWTCVPTWGALVYEGPAWRVWASINRRMVETPIFVDVDGNFIGSGLCQLEGGSTRGQGGHELVHGQVMKQPLLQWLQGGYALRDDGVGGKFQFQVGEKPSQQTEKMLLVLFARKGLTKFPCLVHVPGYVLQIEGPSPQAQHWYYSKYWVASRYKIGKGQTTQAPTGKPFQEYQLAAKELQVCEEVEVFDQLVQGGVL